MTLPGLVLLLLILALIELLTSRLRGRSVITRRHRPVLTAAGMDFMAVLTQPEKVRELDQRASEKIRKVEHEVGTPARSSVDLASGTARIRRTGR